MKNILLLLSCLIVGSVSAQSVFDTPVEPYPGYGLEGKGLHYAKPYGRPSVDCIVNPVSMTYAFTDIEVTELVAGQVFTIPVNVLFDFDGDIIRPDGVSDLEVFHTALVEGDVEELLIVGHTDSEGTDEYNLDLGLRRAGAVATILAVLGFDVDLMEIDSAGESLPKVSNTHPDGSDDPVGRQINRRVDVEILRVREQKVTSTKVIQVEKNPQIFHRLSANKSILCGNDGSVQPSVVIPIGNNVGLIGRGVITVPR